MLTPPVPQPFYGFKNIVTSDGSNMLVGLVEGAAQFYKWR
jgi:hypothetical protein